MPLDHYTPAQAALALSLSQKAIYPLYTSLASLTWILTDYFVTIEDEVRYIWPQKRNIAKLSYLWTRYYSILLLCFDVIQIHVYARPGVTNAALCVYTDPITRTAGGILLWSAEIVMQLRVYALYGCSKRVAIFNAILFLTSLGLFFWILIVNTQARWGNISGAVSLINGCPAINGAPLQWVLWIPATVFEGILFGFALWKSAVTTMEEMRSGVSIRKSIMSVVTRDNILYFFGVAMLLTFNNLMVVGVTRIPWFSFAPFHAALGIMTGRMLMHLRKASLRDNFISDHNIPSTNIGPLQFDSGGRTDSTANTSYQVYGDNTELSPIRSGFSSKRKSAKELESGMAFAKQSQISNISDY